MSEHFIGRNGVIEQVRYYRREPEYLKHSPWAFDLESKRTRRVVYETLIWLGVVFSTIGLFVWVYL